MKGQITKSPRKAISLHQLEAPSQPVVHVLSSQRDVPFLVTACFSTSSLRLGAKGFCFLIYFLSDQGKKKIS